VTACQPPCSTLRKRTSSPSACIAFVDLKDERRGSFGAISFEKAIGVDSRRARRPAFTLRTHSSRTHEGWRAAPSRVISERSPRPATLEPIKDWSLTSLEKPTKIGAKGASRDCDVLSKWPTSPPPRNLFPTSSVCLELRPRTGRVNSITKCSLSRVPRLDDGRFSIPAARPRVGRALQTWGENPNFRFAFNPDGAKEFHVDGEDPAGKVFSGVWPATFNGA
jgi:hypothetical protein